MLLLSSDTLLIHSKYLFAYIPDEDLTNCSHPPLSFHIKIIVYAIHTTMYILSTLQILCIIHHNEHYLLRKPVITTGLRLSEVHKGQESDINRYILSLYLGIILIRILLILYTKDINNYCDLQVLWYHKFIY